jgi:hypothetical protein
VVIQEEIGIVEADIEQIKQDVDQKIKNVLDGESYARFEDYGNMNTVQNPDSDK